MPLWRSADIKWGRRILRRYSGTCPWHPYVFLSISRYIVISIIRKISHPSEWSKILFILFIQRAARCSLNLCPDGFFSSTLCGFSLTVSQAFSQGGIPILQEWIFMVGRKPGKLAYEGVLTTLKMFQKNNPGLVFLLFSSHPSGWSPKA